MNAAKIVPFRKDARIADGLTQELMRKGRRYGLDNIAPFTSDKIVIAEWVHMKCRYGCQNYNTNWTCPPATPDSDRIRRILSEYSQALLLEGSKICTDFYLNNQRKRAVQVRCWKGTVSLERLLFLEGYYKAFSLVGECCALCKTCAYPRDCRFPQEKRPSVESFSIDVIGTLANLGKTPNIAGSRQQTYRYFGLILLA